MHPVLKAVCLSIFGFVGCQVLLVRPAACQPKPARPDVQVDFFGPEKGYAVGEQSVVMLCVLRNAGAAPLPANSLRVRCYALAGLDYTEGELTPLVPALESKQSVAFRWRLKPTDSSNELVASVLLTRIDAEPPRAAGSQAPPPADPTVLPRVYVAQVPHLPHNPPDEASGFTLPSAISSPNAARIGNDRICLHLITSAGREALGVLTARDPTAWQVAGIAAPLVQIRSSAEGQSPWWSRFRWSASESHVSPGAATLILTGTCGEDWEAQLTLECKKDSGALNGLLRLKARRPSRLYSIQLPRLISATDRVGSAVSADGTASMVITNPVSDIKENLAASHRGAVTGGIAWAAKPPLEDWLAFQLPIGDADHTVQLGAQWNGGDRGDQVLPGGIVECAFRLFCVTPSVASSDARKFAIP